MADPLADFDAQVRRLVDEARGALGVTAPLPLERPPPGMADRAIATFPLAKELRKPPPAIANEFVQQILPRLAQAPLVARCEAAQGYVNFWVRREEAARQILPHVLAAGGAYGSLPANGKRLILEHTSANPNGPLHVGRARNPIIGDTLVRIFRKAGWTVESQYYLDDMGKQVAILAWGRRHLNASELEPSASQKVDHDLVRYYQEANRKMEGDPQVAAEVQALVQKSEEGDAATLRLFEDAYKPVLDGMMASLREVGVAFDSFVKESGFVIDGAVEDVTQRLERLPLSKKEDDGALWLDLASYGIAGRSQRFVYRRRDGTSLYATRDVAYHFWKANGADRLVNVLGEDHKLQAQQVRICLELLGCQVLPEVVFYSFVSLPEGKMSTRRKRVVFLDDLIDEAVDLAYEEVRKRRGDELDEATMRRIARAVGIGALRYNIVRVQPEKGIVFRWEEALNFEGSSAPFVQYAYARCASILRKAGEGASLQSPTPGPHPSELEMLYQIARLPRVVEEAAQGARPHAVAGYAQDLAAAFNAFYRDCPVLNAEGAVRAQRLAEVAAAKTALGSTLELLGVPALETM